MHDINENIESPLELKVSFDKLLKHYEVLAESDDELILEKAKRILKIAETYPELRKGFSETSILKKRKKEISVILQDSFSPVLTKNEIKTASVPFHNLIFNSSDRFKNIISTAGDDFELKIKNMPKDDTYIMACTIILAFCYGYSLNFKRPFYYEIPDVNGVMRYYKILYNADFIEITPKKSAPKITQEDYEILLDSFENIDLWKEKFPPNSYTFKGFVISNIFDVTDDQSISNVKSALIGDEKCSDENIVEDFSKIFRSLLGVNDIQIGFSIYNKEESTFERIYDVGGKSFLLNKAEKLKCSDALCKWSYKRLLQDNKYFSVSDVDKMFKASKRKTPHIDALHEQGIKSAIFAPIANDDGLMGVLEIASNEPLALNSINANKLEDVMPFIVSAVERSKNDEENLIEAIIQQECTSIHPSVSWKFKSAAKQFLIDKQRFAANATFKNISFKKVYPLFGQMDVKGSSHSRNNATKKDLILQLSLAEKIFKKLPEKEHMPIYEQIKFQIQSYTKEINVDFKVDSEQQISGFFKREIEPLFRFLQKKDKAYSKDIEDYFGKINKDLGVVYYYRKKYDDTIALINKKMSNLLDQKQVDAQQMYPHFFERYKTDGVEHNMYIGESITKEDSFNVVYLYNLRLWQLQVMCEMEREFYNSQSEYPLSLDVASMILVFNQPLSIRFRMDEKRFDVDGTYNARYEVVKKRVDKALIKGTNERVTQSGKIAIVYSQKEDEAEYLRYINFLQSKSILDCDIEILELQDLQGVTGLKAIRVSVLYHKKDNDKAFYTYNDLMKEIKK
ncbi:GAF domain-containing protein [Pontimicrobium aquaticum]|uniref:GAF domain-containing protein n=1 Tax=Pontimicrobium aquaticum TaxID=2565367 RepID=A0A4U0F0J8_9FLAO|nr:GAF domain-containing protein [Pontimicrobium aquaticum]TJY37873.1 GAF domain-containing protein [Pontimicrobium aquaticum]